MTQALTPLAVSHADVLRYLADHPRADGREIAAATGRLASNVRRDMPRLVKDGLVAPKGALTPRGRAALEVMDGSKAAPRPDAIVGALHHEIGPNPDNPRRAFDPQELEDLSGVIAAKGLLQNLVVREAPPGANGVRYLIVAGERRWRAIGLAIGAGEWPKDRPIPVKVVDVDDTRAAELALVENLARKGLEPLEEAHAFQALRDVHGVPTAEIGRRIGATQRFVQQRLQLLELDAPDRQALAEGKLKVEDARKRLAKPKPDPVALYEKLAGEHIVPAAYQDLGPRSSTAERPAPSGGETAVGRRKLLALVDARLVAAVAALDRDGSIMSDLRRVKHDELWTPRMAIAFLRLVQALLDEDPAAETMALGSTSSPDGR